MIFSIPTITRIWLILLLASASVSDYAAALPNIIFIFTDDMGYGDLQCYGHPYAQTPNIDRLAKEGTKFMNFHVTDNICPGSRTGFMTSRSPASFPNYSEDYGFMGAKTITELLKGIGYKTGQFGKWNIGPAWSSSPGTYGIDEYQDASRLVPTNGRSRDAPIYDDAIDFINRHMDQPFYLNIWDRVPHTPINPPPEVLNAFPQITVDRSLFGQHQQESFDRILQYGGDITVSMRNYLSELQALDTEVGRLLDFLDDNNLSDDTIVAFSSDNGPTYIDSPQEVLDIGYAGGLRGGKHTYFEGGTRVPFIVRWPGHVPAGRVNEDSLISALDWLPTLSTIANVAYDSTMFEGEDVSDIWKGACRSRNNPLFWRVPYDPNADLRVMKHGNWKYHMKGDALYELDSDPGENQNVASQYPQIAISMRTSLQAWNNALPSTVSTFMNNVPLQAFDPNAKPVKIGPPAGVDVSDREHQCYNDGSRSPSTVVVPIPTPTPPVIPPNCILSPGGRLSINEYINCGSQKFGVSSDGNIVFQDGNDIKWDAGISGAVLLNMQPTDGNLVAYSTTTALWSSNYDTANKVAEMRPYSSLKISGNTAMVQARNGVVTWQVSYIEPTKAPVTSPQPTTPTSSAGPLPCSSTLCNVINLFLVTLWGWFGGGSDDDE